MIVYETCVPRGWDYGCAEPPVQYAAANSVDKQSDERMVLSQFHTGPLRITAPIEAPFW